MLLPLWVAAEAEGEEVRREPVQEREEEVVVEVLSLFSKFGR